jgi:hypothetical protein
VIDVLRSMGASVELVHLREESGEAVADLRIVGGRLKAVQVWVKRWRLGPLMSIQFLQWPPCWLKA